MATTTAGMAKGMVITQPALPSANSLFSKVPGCPQGIPNMYYSNGKAWKEFLESPVIKNKNWMEMIEIVVKDFETEDIRQGKQWIWVFDMEEQSILCKVFIENLPKMTRFLMSRWENSLIGFYLLRPSTTTKAILKIVEAILPKDRLANFHRITGGFLEINARLERMGRSLEERRFVCRL